MQHSPSERLSQASDLNLSTYNSLLLALRDDIPSVKAVEIQQALHHVWQARQSIRKAIDAKPGDINREYE
ncbi:hypothetical protein [Nostoc sp. PA-18-2419]|uniref:hypothetical protein n=1 Tax=Nostoc sp. PA-18-2419 TaxID=2575443 RepID=UPI001109703B|nr:hypothetical protein [Nostoc sp. PA-18-2419]